MPSEAVQPLRINKNTPSSSLTKMAGRPLSEISPMAARRNSPSYNQATKSMMFNKREPSPFDSSPLNTSNISTNSPRAFWQGRDPTSPSRLGESENAYDNGIASPRRTSLERLKKASRVKNSSMFERQQEYDPASAPLSVDRPLAAGRPLSTQIQGNAFDGQGLEGLRKAHEDGHTHRRGQSLTKIPMFAASAPTSPVKHSESGRVSNASTFNPDSSILSEDNSDIRTSTPRPLRPLRRQAKSVTFDQGPPQINEYEMVTPDPSSVASGSREGSYDDYDSDSDAYNDERPDIEDSFDASLEDTEKTPVVLPGDWHGMTPENARHEISHNFGDDSNAHDGSPSSSAKASGARPSSARSNSIDRPLPPIPGIAAAAERAGNQQRNLPSPPRAAGVSKAEILDMKKRSSLSMEDRFKLMGLGDSSPEPSPTKKSNGRAVRVEKLQKAHIKDQGFDIHIDEHEITGTVAGAEVQDLPIISRESVLRKVKSQHLRPTPERDASPNSSSIYSKYDFATLDPDVPIPSREVSSEFEDHPVEDFAIKREDDESEVDVYSIPELYSVDRSQSNLDDQSREGSVIRRTSGQSNAGQTNSSSEDDTPPTPKNRNTSGELLQEPSLPWLKDDDKSSQRSSLPEFESLLDDDDFRSGLGSFMSREEDVTQQLITPPINTTPPKLEAVPDFLQRPSTPLSQLQTSQGSSDASVDDASAEVNDGEADLSDSPGSVIHHPIAIEPEECATPIIPERASTIKGSGLKARPSLTHGDIATLATQSRQVSDEEELKMPPVPTRSPRRKSSIGVATTEPLNVPDAVGDIRKPSFQGISLGGLGGNDDFGLGMELNKEFDKLIEAEKKGYKMRENSKVVVARNRDFSDEKAPPSPTKEEDLNARGTRSAGSSPRKSLSKAWTTEPYQAKTRRRSIRTASGSRKTVPASGPVPPLPGQESATISEEAARDSYEEQEWEEGAERGRLFVKVMGVKDLDLPLPKHEQTQFQLTLDNGLHCVTTSWLDLARSAPIGQEFELVVLNELEFQLTLQTKLTPPPQPAKSMALSTTESPMKSPTKAAKKGGLSSLLMSPKKRKEAEARRLAEEREREVQQQRERDAAASRAAHASRSKSAPSAWDLLHELVAPDGSFARAYISLKSFEDACFGKSVIVDVPAYNEWAAEQDASVIESMRSKRGRNGADAVRRPPYQVGKLQLQLLYVPKPKGAKDEDLPRSLNGALREMDRCREASTRMYEGSLSQQGGDCPYWRRRFFRLSGTKLTAFHESTHQPRATINLAKAVKLIDDKSSLIQPDVAATTGKKRRKSAFAEEEEGYMFVEEGFRIRFGNGETIDFYADTAEAKQGWMNVLSDVIGKSDAGSSAKGWTELVLRREAKLGLQIGRKPVPKSQQHSEIEERPSSAPKLEDRRLEEAELDDVPMPLDKSPRHAGQARAAMSQAQRRQKTRSMIF